MGMHFALRWRTGLAALLFLTAFGALAADEKGCALLLLHDKGSSPQAMEVLARKLKSSCSGKTIEMPWSQRRGNDSDYKTALREIGAQVKELRRHGFARVLVGGQGLGANAAIAYAAEIGDVDGVMALAPGHPPGQMSNGLGDLPLTTPRIRQHIPLLWVIGTKDPLYEAGEAYAFAKAPPHPLSRYVIVQADHNGTPEAAAKPIGEWIKSIE